MKLNFVERFLTVFKNKNFIKLILALLVSKVQILVLNDYYQAIDAGCLPVSKGIKLSRTDILRREVIMQIMSNFQLDKSEIELKYRIHFDNYFAAELEAILPLKKMDCKVIF